MKIRVQRKIPVFWAVRVEGRQLAPAMYQFDNLNEVEEICRQQYISFEDVVCDEASGLIIIPGVKPVRIGNFLVEDDEGLQVFKSLEELQANYKIMEN